MHSSLLAVTGDAAESDNEWTQYQIVDWNSISMVK